MSPTAEAYDHGRVNTWRYLKKALIALEGQDFADDFMKRLIAYERKNREPLFNESVELTRADITRPDILMRADYDKWRTP